ncbi:MAG TPA: hypothetical protein VLI71_10970, partial [Gammaproteobacteria bacterium]|nr:hypothetical protein [Gammaproteobacteria bacterium]
DGMGGQVAVYVNQADTALGALLGVGTDSEGDFREYENVGKVYGRVVADDEQNIDLTSNSDDIELLRITRGWLSRGTTYALTAFGGEAGDTFNVYSNKAELRMEGEAGNDVFVIRAFIAEDDIIANGGNDDDHFEYNINAPVSINGGLGFDTVVVIGTERADAFLITSEGIFGAGLSVNVDGVEEAIEVDGLEGDDYFFVLSTRDDVVTTVIGGLGSDSFIVTGDVTQDIISQNLDGVSAVVNHGANRAVGSNYDNLLVDGLAVTIASETQGKVVVDQDGGGSPGFTRVTEDSGDSDAYSISLFRPAGLHASTVAYLTVSAASSSTYDRRLPTRAAQPGDPGAPGTSPHVAESLLISIDGGATWQQSAVLTFTAADWDTPQQVLVKAAHDDAIEGERKVMISHSLHVESSSQADIDAFDEVAISNVEVQLLDDDLGTLIVEELNAAGGVDNESRVLEGVAVPGGTSAIDDVYRVRLSVAPTADVTLGISLDGAQLMLVDGSDAPVTEITFTPGNWDQWVTLKVKAVDDVVRENGKISRIVHSFASDDAVYDDAADVEVEVRVLDNDSASVLVSETEGATRLVRDGVSEDEYTLRLVSEPDAPVTVNIFGDGQTRVVSALRGGVSVLTTALVGLASSVDVTVGVDASAPAGERDTLERDDGRSWIDDGFRVGTQFRIGAGSTIFKVNDIVDVVDEET